MRLRSQLALSHLKVLLAFVLIHLLLFVGATQFSDRNDGSDSARVEDLKVRILRAKDLPELLTLVEESTALRLQKGENLSISTHKLDGTPWVNSESAEAASFGPEKKNEQQRKRTNS